jgi:hypothetical protein
MTVVVYLAAGGTTRVPDVTAVVRRAGAIVCLQGGTVVAAFPQSAVAAYAQVADAGVAARPRRRCASCGRPIAAVGVRRYCMRCFADFARRWPPPGA